MELLLVQLESMVEIQTIGCGLGILVISPFFRVYANNDNEPSAYDEGNKPYSPKHALPVSIAGVQEGDYAMIMGYPGSTDRYLTSWGVKEAVEVEQPARVKIRELN